MSLARASNASSEIVEAVAVDVAGGADGGACVVTGVDRGNSESVGAVEGGETELVGKRAAVSEDDKGFVFQAADDDVVEAVGVDIAGGANGMRGESEEFGSAEGVAVGSVEVEEFEIGGEAAGLTEYEIGHAGVGIESVVGPLGANEQIVEAIAIVVTGEGGGVPGLVVGKDAADDDSFGAVAAVFRQQVGEVEMAGEVEALFEGFEAGSAPVP